MQNQKAQFGLIYRFSLKRKLRATMTENSSHLFMQSSCSSTVCDLVGKFVVVILTLAEIAAIIAVYKSHFGTGGASFGSTTGSLSIMALAINTVAWAKFGQMHCGGTCSK